MPGVNVMPSMSLNTESMEYDPAAGQAVYGRGLVKKGPAAWQVNLAPKEREILKTIGKEKFPPGYERLLKLYYRNLAMPKEKEK
tara:strand:- start:545 stop:796 length:252 start_codon:yes stop_codon:yes gene_type:complete